MTTIEVFHERSRKKAKAGAVSFVKLVLNDPEKWGSDGECDRALHGNKELKNALLEPMGEKPERWVVHVKEEESFDCMFSLKDLTFLSDVHLYFDGNGELTRFKFVCTKALVTSLEKLKQLRKEEAISKGKRKIIVVTLDTKLKKWQTVNLRDTIAARLGFGKSLFRFLKRFHVYQLVGGMTTFLFLTCHAALVFPFVRDLTSDLIFTATTGLVVTWTMFNILLSNFIIATAILRNFIFWYLVFFLIFVMLGFMNAFDGDGRALFLCSSTLGLVLFVGLIDAAHPSTRKNGRLVSMIMFVAVGTCAITLVNCYFLSENLADPINRKPFLSWQLGPNPESQTHIFGLTLALDSLTSILFWIFSLAMHMFKHPHESLLFCPDVRLQFMKPLEFITYEARMEGQTAQSYRNSKVGDIYETNSNAKSRITSGMMSTRASIIRKGTQLFLDTKHVDLEGDPRETIKSIWDDLEGTSRSIITFWTKSSESLNEGKTVSLAKSALETCRRKGPKRTYKRLLTLEGPFVDRVFVIDSRDTLGQAIFGKRFATGYFRFCSKTKWLTIAIFAAMGFTTFSIMHMHGESVRARFPSIDWAYYSVAMSVGMIGMNSMFFLNYPLFMYLLYKFETYFHLYLVLVAAGLYIHLIGGIGNPRSCFVVAGLSVYIPTIAFGDAVHPSSKLTWMGYLGAFMSILAVGAWAIGLLFFPHTLEEPLQTSAILNLGIGDSAVEVNIYTMGVPKFVLVFLWLCVNTTISIWKPGTFQTIKAKLVFSKDYHDYQSRMSRMNTSNFDDVQRIKRFTTNQSEVHPLSSFQPESEY